MCKGALARVFYPCTAERAVVSPAGQVSINLWYRGVVCYFAAGKKNARRGDWQRTLGAWDTGKMIKVMIENGLKVICNGRFVSRDT